MKTARPSVLLYGLLFAVVAALMVFQPLTRLALLKLFYEEGKQLIQPVPAEGVPIPRGLVWSSSTYGLIFRLGSLTSAAVLALEIGLACVLLYGLLRILNPTFRITTGVDWDRQLLLRTYIHTPPLIKAFLIAIAAFLPLFFLWQLLAWALGDSLLSFWLRMALTGAAVWLLFSRNGIAGDYDSGNYEFPRARGALASLLARGALAGTAGALAAWFAPPTPERWFDFYRTLGGIGEAQWGRIAQITLGLAALSGFACGGLAVALGAPARGTAERLRRGALPALLLGLTLWLGQRGLPGLLARRYDYAPASRVPPARRLARAAGIREASSGGETLLLLRPGRAIPLRMETQSIVGVDASAQASQRLEAFLRRRDFQTALSAPAFIAMHDSASLRWDQAESMRVDWLNLAHCPEPVYLTLLISTLQTCAATPAALACADRLASGREVAFPDSDSRELMADLYARLGERAKAEQWYRRASLPESQIGARLSERLMFTRGRITGRLLRNGRGVVGARVGLLPAGAVPELFRTQLEPGQTRPFALRWICATTVTDAQGRFALENVVAGSYRLVAAGPALSAPPFRPLALRKRVGDLGNLFVGFARPETRLPDIDLAFPETALSR